MSNSLIKVLWKLFACALINSRAAFSDLLIALYPTGMEDEICPYATFHLLGFREEMDPSKALNFQTFPHQNGMGGPAHVGTLGPNGPMPVHMHSRSGSQSMVSVLFHVRLLIYLVFILTWLKFKLCSTSCFSIRFSHPLATTTKQLLCISVKHPLNNTHTCIPSDC